MVGRFNWMWVALYRVLKGKRPSTDLKTCNFFKHLPNFRNFWRHTQRTIYSGYCNCLNTCSGFCCFKANKNSRNAVIIIKKSVFQAEITFIHPTLPHVVICFLIKTKTFLKSPAIILLSSKRSNSCGILGPFRITYFKSCKLPEAAWFT